MICTLYLVMKNVPEAERSAAEMLRMAKLNESLIEPRPVRWGWCGGGAENQRLQGGQTSFKTTYKWFRATGSKRHEAPVKHRQVRFRTEDLEIAALIQLVQVNILRLSESAGGAASAGKALQYAEQAWALASRDSAGLET